MSRRYVERHVYTPGKPLAGYARSHAVARLAYIAGRCDFLAVPFPSSPVPANCHCPACTCTVNGRPRGVPHQVHSCCVLRALRTVAG